MIYLGSKQNIDSHQYRQSSNKIMLKTYITIILRSECCHVTLRARILRLSLRLRRVLRFR